MKILFLSAWYPNRYDSMPGLFVKQHAEAVAQLHDVAVLYTQTKEEGTWELEEKTVNGVYSVTVYYKASKGNWLINNGLTKGVRFLYTHYIGFRRILKVFGKPQLIHVNILTRCGLVALFAKWILRIPYVITEHWSRYLSTRNDYSGSLRKIATKLVVKNSLGIVTVSNALKKAMIDRGLNHPVFKVIHNSVDTLVFVPSVAQNPSGIKTFSHISCFDDAAKNISGILRVIASLKDKRTDFRFFLVGEGPDKQKIERLSDSLDLTNKYVFFTGLLEGLQLVEIYQQSLFTVLFSNYENMPVVIAESMSCGVPVIATRVGGIPEVVNETNGIIVEAKNEAGLLLAIDQMLNTATNYNQGEIRNYALKTFSKEGFIQQYEDFYRNSLKKN